MKSTDYILLFDELIEFEGAAESAAGEAAAPRLFLNAEAVSFKISSLDPFSVGLRFHFPKMIRLVFLSLAAVLAFCGHGTANAATTGKAGNVLFGCLSAF